MLGCEMWPAVWRRWAHPNFQHHGSLPCAPLPWAEPLPVGCWRGAFGKVGFFATSEAVGAAICCFWTRGWLVLRGASSEGAPLLKRIPCSSTHRAVLMTMCGHDAFEVLNDASHFAALNLLPTSSGNPYSNYASNVVTTSTRKTTENGRCFTLVFVLGAPRVCWLCSCWVSVLFGPSFLVFCALVLTFCTWTHASACKKHGDRSFFAPATWLVA